MDCGGEESSLCLKSFVFHGWFVWNFIMRFFEFLKFQTPSMVENEYEILKIPKIKRSYLISQKSRSRFEKAMEEYKKPVKNFDLVFNGGIDFPSMRKGFWEQRYPLKSAELGFGKENFISALVNWVVGVKSRVCDLSLFFCIVLHVFVWNCVMTFSDSLKFQHTSMIENE